MFFNVFRIIERTTKNIPAAMLQNIRPRKNTTQIGSCNVFDDCKNRLNAQMVNSAPSPTNIHPSVAIFLMILLSMSFIIFSPFTESGRCNAIVLSNWLICLYIYLCVFNEINNPLAQSPKLKTKPCLLPVGLICVL